MSSKLFVVKLITDGENEMKYEIVEDDNGEISSNDEIIRLHASENEDESKDMPDESMQFEQMAEFQSDVLHTFSSQSVNANDESLSEKRLQSFVEVPPIKRRRRKKRSVPKPDEPKREKTQKFSGWIAYRHKFNFQEKWSTKYPFLVYDKEKNLMFCKPCRKYVTDYRRTSPFIVGTNNFRESMIKYHHQSSMHTECQKLLDTLTCEDSKAAERDLYKDQLSPVFKSVYFIFKNKMPYAHYPLLCKSLKQEGTDIAVYSTNIKVVPILGKFIGMAFEKELACKIGNVPEFSLVIDSSFQRNVECHDLVYLKYLDTFMVQTVFLGVIDSLTKLQDSIYNTLTALFRRYSIDNWVDKLVCIMTDRSDSHLWLEGFLSRIESMSPQNYFSHVGYLPHKVKFCSEIVQKHKITSTFDALLWSIYCYYEKIDKSKINLIHMNAVLDEISKCYGGLPKNSYNTLYYETLKAVMKDYPLLVRLLETGEMHPNSNWRVRKSSSKIVHVILRSSFICKLAVFIDIFSCLNDFATKLSNEHFLPYDIYMLLDEVCISIEEAADGEGPTAVEVAEELIVNPCCFQGIEIGDDNNVHQILPEMKNFSIDVISYLKSLIDESFLEKSFIFNVSLWPEKEEIAEFGNSEFIDIFLKLNGETEDIKPVLAEWNLFKTEILALFPFEVRQNSKSVIMKMATQYSSDFPFVNSVLRKILLLNFESSDIKKGYYEMCQHKSALRSVLSLTSLQTAMMISMHGPSLNEFDFSLAMELFLNSKHRQFRKKIVDKKLSLNFTSDQEEDL